jgi:hypothetical protein
VAHGLGIAASVPVVSVCFLQALPSFGPIVEGREVPRRVSMAARPGIWAPREARPGPRRQAEARGAAQTALSLGTNQPGGWRWWRTPAPIPAPRRMGPWAGAPRLPGACPATAPRPWLARRRLFHRRDLVTAAPGPDPARGGSALPRPAFCPPGPFFFSGGEDSAALSGLGRAQLPESQGGETHREARSLAVRAGGPRSRRCLGLPGLVQSPAAPFGDRRSGAFTDVGGARQPHPGAGEAWKLRDALSAPKVGSGKSFCSLSA